MTKTIYRVSIFAFILSVVVLTFIAILSIWDVVGDDAFAKAVATVATIGGATGLIMGAAKFIDSRNTESGEQEDHQHSQM
jgi:polyferredoxin